MSLANAVVMVEPRDFGFNEDTALDNAFQHHPDADSDEIKHQALNEFWQFVECLDKHHLDVITLTSPAGVAVPDALFPNNWFSTTETEIIVYPMKAANRQLECQPEALCEKLLSNGYQFEHLVELHLNNNLAGILEGTGVLVFDHQNNEVYANISERCEAAALAQFCEQFNVKAWPITAVTSQTVPVYHTNVLMAVGQSFAVITEEILTSDAINATALNRLKETKTDLVTITEDQMIESMCGNILQLQSNRGEPLIVMSQSAFEGFTKSQLKVLEKHGTLVSSDINTIEYVGGGSARCMLAEIFLQKA